jgi:S-adenosyl-L-methionine hydrolase (adenosine-forming)
VGPDNGVLSWALAEQKVRAIHALENRSYFLQPASHTFHGRDIFAPVAAHLSRGVAIDKLGPALKGFARLDWPEPRRLHDGVEGEVVHIDRFGNAITNLRGDVPGITGVAIRAARKRQLCLIQPFYGAVPRGQPLALVGSSGFLEIAVNGGSAEATLGLKVGTRVVSRF